MQLLITWHFKVPWDFKLFSLSLSMTLHMNANNTIGHQDRDQQKIKHIPMGSNGIFVLFSW